MIEENNWRRADLERFKVVYYYDVVVDYVDLGGSVYLLNIFVGYYVFVKIRWRDNIK